MAILLIINSIFFAYLGGILAKFFFFQINKEDFYFYFPNVSDNFFKKYIFLYYFFPKHLSEKYKRNKDQKFLKLNRLSTLSALFGTTVLTIYSFGVIRIFSEFMGFSLLILLAVLTFFTVALLYLAIYDIVSFSIPENFVKATALLAILANLVIGGVKVIAEYSGLNLLANIPLGNIDNLLAGILFSSFIYLIVRITKEKGMGEGDIYLVLIIGLILGWPNTLVSFLSTLVLGSIISLIIAAYLKHFKNLIVPFVPFLLLGFVIAISFGIDIYSIFIFI